MLRGSYGTGFSGADALRPVPAAVAEPRRRACRTRFAARSPATTRSIAMGVYHDKGGRQSALQPEKSQQLNARHRLRAVRGLSASIDYYWVKVKNADQVVPVDAILGPDYAPLAPRLRRAQAARCSNIRTCPARSTTSSNTRRTSARSRPRASISTCSGAAPATPFGRFTLGLNGTYVLTTRTPDSSPSLSPPRWARAVLTAPSSRTGNTRRLNWTLWVRGARRWRTLFRSGLQRALPGRRRERLHDAQRRIVLRLGPPGPLHRFPEHDAALGMRNLWTRRRRCRTSRTRSRCGIDPAYADPRGRMFYGAIRYAFK